MVDTELNIYLKVKIKVEFAHLFLRRESESDVCVLILTEK